MREALASHPWIWPNALTADLVHSLHGFDGKNALVDLIREFPEKFKPSKARSNRPTVRDLLRYLHRRLLGIARHRHREAAAKGHPLIWGNKRMVPDSPAETQHLSERISQPIGRLLARWDGSTAPESLKAAAAAA